MYVSQVFVYIHSICIYIYINKLIRIFYTYMSAQDTHHLLVAHTMRGWVRVYTPSCMKPNHVWVAVLAPIELPYYSLTFQGLDSGTIRVFWAMVQRSGHNTSGYHGWSPLCQCKRICICTCKWKFKGICICKCICISSWICSCKCTCIWTSTCTCVCNLCICICIWICICTRTHTHTTSNTQRANVHL